MTHKTIFDALLAIQSEITEPPKDGVNPHFRSTYVTLPGLMAHLRPLCNKHGVLMLQSIDGNDLRTDLTCAGQPDKALSSKYPIKPAKDDPQGFGSAVKYARRYALCTMFGISGEDDDDGNAASHAPAKAAAKPAPQKAEKAAEKPKEFGYDEAVAQLKQCKTSAQLAAVGQRIKVLWPFLSEVEKKTLTDLKPAVEERIAIVEEPAK